MLKRAASEFWRDRSAAVAPLYALALFGLIGIAGIGMDYGRLMAMSSEMQNAADQAALAAATQLDGKSDAITRAQSAVTNYFASSSPSGATGELVVNRTLLANDTHHGRNSALTDVSFTFYTSYDRDADTFGSTTTDGTQAKVVLVRVNARRAYYALTPVVDAFSSRDINVDAVAGIDSAICQVPPLMVCARDANFPSDADKGKGVLMEPGAQVGSWTPGTFGYLDLGSGANAVKALLESNGNANSCAASGGNGVQAQPGNIASAPDALNTRFDIYNSPYKASDCKADGTDCPAPNTRKDVVRAEQWQYKNLTSAPARPSCSSTLGASNGNPKVTVGDWQQLPASSLPSSSQVQGFPRDYCHITGTCVDGKYGDGNWNLAGYRTAHPSVPTTLTTRYDIYKWEKSNSGTGMQPILANAGDAVSVTGCNGSGTCDYTWTNYCAYPAPINATTANNPARDRRVITVAAVDCSGTGASSHSFAVNRWVDIFLTEPSLNRTSPNTQAYQIYGEVIGAATRPDNTNAFQYYGRNKVVLLR